MPVSGSLPMAATSSLASGASSSEIEKGIAAAPHVKHPVLVQVEFGLEAVVAAQDLHRQPRRHDLGDGSRSEGTVGVLGDQLVALLVNHEHDPRWSHACDLLLDAGERRGGGRSRARARARASRRDHIATPGHPTYRLRTETGKPPFCVGRGQAPKLTPTRLTCRIIAASRPFEGAKFAIFATHFSGYFSTPRGIERGFDCCLHTSLLPPWSQ